MISIPQFKHAYWISIPIPSGSVVYCHSFLSLPGYYIQCWPKCSYTVRFDCCFNKLNLYQRIHCRIQKGKRHTFRYIEKKIGINVHSQQRSIDEELLMWPYLEIYGKMKDRWFNCVDWQNDKSCTERKLFTMPHRVLETGWFIVFQIYVFWHSTLAIFRTVLLKWLNRRPWWLDSDFSQSMCVLVLCQHRLFAPNMKSNHFTMSKRLNERTHWRLLIASYWLKSTYYDFAVNWCEVTQIHSSKAMMPISYHTIFISNFYYTRQDTIHYVSLKPNKQTSKPFP